MLAVMAWRNVWRNKKRSSIIVTAIAFGLWGGLMGGAVMVGWGESMVNTAINRDLAHLQIHKYGYARGRDVSQFIPSGMELVKDIRLMPGVDAVSGRTLVDGLAASPISTFGVQIVGVVPEQAKTVTDIHNLLVGGSYFGDSLKNAIVIGKKLADRLNLKLRSKVVLSFQAMDSTLVYAGFKVSGMYESESAQFDESHAYVRQSDLTALLGSTPVVHEIAIRTRSSLATSEVVNALRAKYPALSVETWKELSPELAVTADGMRGWSYVFVGIILVALLFGITNTMLMAVIERIRELGILMAVGMKKGKVFLMILLETIILSLTGGISGMSLAGFTLLVLSRTGIDLSSFASSLGTFGASTILYPVLPMRMYFDLVGMIVVAACVASALPAWRAVQLQPAKAIRTS